MKIYPADQMLPVNSVKRKPEPCVIPPWSISGRATSGYALEWSPERPIIITGGYARAMSASGDGSTGLYFIKENPLLVAQEQVVAYIPNSAMGPDKLRVEFVMPNPMYGSAIISQYDTLKLLVNAPFGFTPHSGLTLQLYGEVLN